MSARVFQSVINQLKETVGKAIYVLDDAGVVIACTDLVHVGETRAEVLGSFDEDTTIITSEGYTYCPLGSYTRPENIIAVEGEDAEAADLCHVLSVSFLNIKSLYG